MKYFIVEAQRSGTCYHEFYKGKWDGYTFWKKDSILLHDSILTKDFVDAVREVVSSYNYYGTTIISASQWQNIGNAILQKDAVSQEIYKEANAWLKDVFRDHGCFTILGI